MKKSDFTPVISLAQSIGRKVLSWRNESKSRYIYSKSDFKTEADRRAHDLYVDQLKVLFTNTDVISEESKGLPDIRPDSYWLIDPIDGTASWYHGYDGFVTQAAYISNGIPVFGIIYAPVTEQTWAAVAGEGAYLNGKWLPSLGPSARLILTDNTPVPHGVTQGISTSLEATGYFESGSMGLKAALVADGTVDLFVKDVAVRDWDMAPAAVILREVDGLLALSDGSPYLFDGPFQKDGGFIVARDAELMSCAIEAFSQLKS